MPFSHTALIYCCSENAIEWFNLFSRWEYTVKVFILRWTWVCQHSRWLGTLYWLWHYSRFFGRTLLRKFIFINSNYTHYLFNLVLAICFSLEICVKRLIIFSVFECKWFDQFFFFFSFGASDLKFKFFFSFIVVVVVVCYYFDCFQWLTLWI